VRTFKSPANPGIAGITTTTLNFFPALAAERIRSVMALPMIFFTKGLSGEVLVMKNWFSM